MSAKKDKDINIQTHVRYKRQNNELFTPSHSHLELVPKLLLGYLQFTIQF